MRRFIFIPIIVVAFFAQWCVRYWNKVLPNTTLNGVISIAGMTKDQVSSLIDEKMNEANVKVKLPDREVTTSFHGLGLKLNKEEVIDQLFTDTGKHKLTRLINGLLFTRRHKLVSVTLAAEEKEIIFPVKVQAHSRLNYDANTGQFAYDPPLYDFALTTSEVAQQGIMAFGQDAPVIAATARKFEHKSEILEDLNGRLANVASELIIVRVKDGPHYSDIPLSPEEIRHMLAFTAKGSETVLDIDRTAFETTLAAKLTDKQKENFQLQEAYPNTVALLNNRFGGDRVDPVVLGIDDGPTTDGSLAKHYIEVDISQQKMYFFVEGNVHKEYRVSTGYDYPTPVGEFHIMNKAPKAFSDIYDVWMDYWMAFKWASDVGASLGIHEIAYALGEKNKRIYNLGDYIGEPKTGGCIALSPGDAKEVYDLSYVGMLVKVVE